MKKKTLRNILAAVVCLVIAVAIGAVVYSNIPKDDSANEQSTSTPNMNQDPIVITGFPEIPFSFSTLCKEATDIAVVRVLDWIGEESPDPYFARTYFEAEVVDLVYGESLKQNERFTLSHGGSSKYIYEEELRFKIGDELLLFLKSFPNKGTVESVKTDYVYRHIGVTYTVFDPIEIDQTRFLKARMRSLPVEDLADADVFADNIEQVQRSLEEKDADFAKRFSDSNEEGLVYDFDKLAKFIRQNAEDE